MDAWLAVRPDNTVEIYPSKVEIGGGETKAIAQIAGEELDLPLSRVVMHRVQTSVTPWDAGTFGSQSVSSGGAAVRVIAATARQALPIVAAARLHASGLGELAVHDGVMRGPGGAVTYGQLIGGQRFGVNVNPAAPRKRPAAYTVVGQPVPRFDLPRKLTGADGPHPYLVKVRLPGMLHARILRPPAFGATVVCADTAAVERMPGVVAVVPLAFGPGMKGWNAVWNMAEGEFLAVVAESEGQAIEALNALAARVTWSRSATLPTRRTTEETADDMLTLPTVRSVVHGPVGDPAAAIAGAPLKATHHYATPYQTNAPIVPDVALADVRGSERATVYSGAQVPFSVQAAVAAVTGIPADKVDVVVYAASGSDGRGNLDDPAVEAAILSQTLGRPVRVQWTRQEEFVWSTCRTPLAFRFQGGVDRSGRLLGWQSVVWSDTHIVDPGALSGATYGGVLPIYEALRQTTEHYVQSALRKGAMRGLGAWATVFAHEGFIDEFAYLSGGLPPAQPRRPARPGGDPDGRPHGRLAAARGAERERGRAGDRLVGRRARRHVRGRGGPGGGGSGQRAGPGGEGVRRPRLRPGHPPRRPSQPDRGRHRPGHRLDVARTAHVRQPHRHERRRVHLPDPAFPRGAPGGGGAHRPPGPACKRCGRARFHGGRSGPRQRLLRRHRGTQARHAAHAGARAGGARLTPALGGARGRSPAPRRALPWARSRSHRSLSEV
ncbi:MAG: molybdopterin-dependent oxidoreductase [Firmicutes bacterium]|nr:molybdopterin-dependent oxidoreductase [Bacillota bacterium]